MENVSLNIRHRMWFMHNGVPLQFSHNVRVYLNQQFRNKWIGHGGPIALPARSPDLDPIDYFVWGHLKSIVYATPVDKIKKLRERIEDVWRRIRQMSGIIRRVRQSMDNDWSSVRLSTEVTSSTSSNRKSSIARHFQQREKITLCCFITFLRNLTLQIFYPLHFVLFTLLMVLLNCKYTVVKKKLK